MSYVSEAHVEKTSYLEATVCGDGDPPALRDSRQKQASLRRYRLPTPAFAWGQMEVCHPARERLPPLLPLLLLAVERRWQCYWAVTGLGDADTGGADSQNSGMVCDHRQAAEPWEQGYCHVHKGGLDQAR